MEKIVFEDLPSQNTPINANNLNKMQENIEDELKKFNGKIEKNGYMILSNGLKLFWGQVESTDFVEDATSTKYKYTVNLPVKCTKFLNAYATFQYGAGESYVGINSSTLENITLHSGPKVDGFYVNWFAIGF